VPPRSAGAWLVAASAGFWLCWALMPGVGVTDAARIFALVGASRGSVLASVVLQLASAAAYAPGAAGLLGSTLARRSRALRLGCVLLVTGAMGSAADAMLHLVAYEMTAPAAPAAALEPVMRRLQGPDLALLLPFVAAFFAGHALVVTALRREGPLARFGFRLLLAAPAIAAAGALAARAGLLPGRLAGLATLGAVAASLAAAGAELLAARPPAPGDTRSA
jgi:hypothetical protein